MPYILRDISKTRGANDGTRTLFESVSSPEVVCALKEWSEGRINAVLMGTLALSFYVKPRFTQDIDFLFSLNADVPALVGGFQRTQRVFTHQKTGINVELLIPPLIKLSAQVVKELFHTSRLIDGIRVASPSGLVAAKLFRMSRQDAADIESLIRVQPIDISRFGLPEEQKAAFAKLSAEVAEEMRTEGSKPPGAAQ